MNGNCLLADWDTADISEDWLLERVSRFLLACLLKHCGLLNLAIRRLLMQPSRQLLCVYHCIYKVRRRILALKMSQAAGRLQQHEETSKCIICLILHVVFIVI